MPPKRHLLLDSQSESSRSPRRRLEEGSNQPTTSTSDRADALWSRVKTALRGLEKSSSVLAPLKSGMVALADCVIELPEADKRRQEFRDIAESLVFLSETLTEHIQTSSSTFMSSCVMNVVNAIQQDINDIKNRQRGNPLSRIGTATQEEDDLIKYYRRIESHFRQLQTNATLSTWSILNEQLANSRLDRLHPVSAATYNSAQSSQIRRRTCSPNTRAGVLGDLTRWATWIDSPKLYWMNGMAGTGKTTISCSLSDTLRRLCLLGASFFCSRTLPDCRDVSRIVPTIAYQLARFSLPFQSALCQVIGKDQDIANCGISDQFERLILEPLLEVKAAIPANVVVVIDALDECSGTSGTTAILDLLFRYAAKLPVKFFVASRPEPSISDRMLAQDNSSRSMFVLHDIEASIIRGDIETYLTSGLAYMSPPPSATQIQQLARTAGSLFIYAATALRYILPENSAVDSHDRLNIMLGMASTPHSRRHNEIDALYSAILKDVVYNPIMDPEEIERIQLVLHTIICVMEPITTLTLAGLLGMDEHKVELALKPLRSVIQISASHGFLTTLHASFPDYMLDRERSKTLFCDREKHCGLLAQHCLEVMNSNLRFNICELESSFDLDEDVPDLPIRMDKAIPSHLFYACRYWMQHLVDSGRQHNSVDILLLLTDFLAVKLLFWMEVLNLRQSFYLCDVILSQACSWLQKHDTPNYLLQICVDAWSFSKFFSSNPVSGSTPHLYVSVLPLCQKDSAMWRWYGSRAKGLASVSGPAVNRRAHVTPGDWGAEFQTDPVAYSPNGVHIVSGSRDCTIRVWDAQSGRMVTGPLEGHTSWVQSVAFSSNGARVVSGSHDCTIRIWDAQSGTMVAGPLGGHSNTVASVAFSPCGARVVSGSHDCTIRIWDAQSGAMVAGPLEGHSDTVTSVAFSPCSARVVSSSNDVTIRIWDAQTGSMVAGPFEGYTLSVTSVASSPDGTRVVCGSSDGMISILNAQTGSMVAGPLKRHAAPLASLTFSSDGARVVSGYGDFTIRTWDARSGDVVAELSDDEREPAWSIALSPDGTRVVSGYGSCTIRIWDAQTGRLVARSLRGDKASVWSVAFSPDGTRVAGGCYDSMARIWDAQSAMMVAGPLEGHTGPVWSVAFSPDGARVVSGSADRTIRIWDAQTGGMVVGPFKGHTNLVRSVAFSPDGARVVSGSYDRTIRIWDAQSGSMVAELLEGHINSVYSVAFSLDGTRVLSYSSGGTIRIWDAKTGSMVVGPFEGNTSWGVRGQFSSDGTRVVSSSGDGDGKNTIQIWDTQSGNMVAGPFEGHIQYVSSVALSSDGALVVSSADDCSIRIWDTPIGSPNLTTSTSHWSLYESGWIMNTNSQRLLWIPKVLRKGLKRAQNTLVIHPDGHTELCFDYALIGMQWRECFL